MSRTRMTWGGKSANGPTLPIEQAARRASAHPQTPDEGITHPAGYADPAQDAYENGDTSSWAEDVHGGPYRTSPAPAVPVDDGGYKHPAAQPGAPAKNASDLRASVEQKAAKCIRVASALLGSEISKAAEAGDKMAVSMIEDQALDFMDLPDARLAATLRRLEAASEDPEKLLRKMLASEEGEEFEEDDDSEEVEETASKKASDDRMAEVMSMLAGIKAEVEALKGHKAEESVDAEESLLAEMLAEEGMTEASDADVDVEAEEMLAAMLAEEQAPVAPEAPAQGSLAQYLDEESADVSMDLGEDPMGLLDDPMMEQGDDEILGSLFASDMKVAGKKAEEEEEEEEEVEFEDKTANTRLASKIRPQVKKASVGAKTVGTQVRSAGARSELNDLANIWESAPDVTAVFKS